MNEISVKQIASILFKKIVIILIATVLGFTLVLLYSLFFIKPRYTSNAYFTITNVPEENLYDSLSPSVIQASVSLAKSVSVLIPVSPVYATVADECGVATSTVRSAVAISINSETFVMQATVTASSPELAHDIAVALGEQIPAYLKSVNIGSASLCNIPSTPTSPSYPNNFRFGLIGGLIGLLASSLIILFITLTDNTVKGETDLSEKITAPVLAEIPSLDKEKKNNAIGLLVRIPYFRDKYLSHHAKPSKNDIITKSTEFGIVEAYKQLRANLLFAVSVGKNNAVVFSSGMPNEGKSTTACNVAISLAQDNKKILLIDADMRKPTIHKKFRLDNRKGLSGFLSGQYPIGEAVKKDVAENLDVITSGVVPPNPSELLSSEAMDRFLEEVSPLYDFILIDTPPISVVSDARNFAAKTSGVVLVARQKMTFYGDVIRSIQSIEQSNSNVLGVVITDVNESEKIYGGYYGKGGSYKYQYSYAYADSSQRNKVDLNDDD